MNTINHHTNVLLAYPLRTLDQAAQSSLPIDHRPTMTRKPGNTGTSNAGNSQEEDSMRSVPGAATPSGSARWFQGTLPAPSSKPFFQNPHPAHSNHPPLYFNSHEASSDPAQPESTLADIRSEATLVVAAFSNSASTRYGTSASRGHPPKAGVSLSDISVSSRHREKKVSKIQLDVLVFMQVMTLADSTIAW